MSWFNLATKGKEIWDGHSTVKGICTGNILATHLFKKGIEQHRGYLWIRESTAVVISNRIPSAFQPISDKISNQLADKIAKDLVEKAPTQCRALITEGKNRLMQMTTTEWLYLAKTSATVSVKVCTQAVSRRIHNYWTRRETPGTIPAQTETIPAPKTEVSFMPPSFMERSLRALLKQYKEDELLVILDLFYNRQICDAIEKALFFSLKPICDKAVQNAIKAITKKGVSQTCDFACKKLLAQAVVPTVYTAALCALKWGANHYGGDEAHSQLEDWTEMAPSPCTILTFSVGIHVLQMARVIWDTAKRARSATRHDHDKEAVKEQIYKLAHKGIKTKIQEKLENNEFFKSFGISVEEQHIDDLVKKLLSEAVDSYWEDLHAKKFAGLPLVS